MCQTLKTTDGHNQTWIEHKQAKENHPSDGLMEWTWAKDIWWTNPEMEIQRRQERHLKEEKDGEEEKDEK